MAIVAVCTVPCDIKSSSNRCIMSYRGSIYVRWGRCLCHENEWLICKRNSGGPHAAKALRISASMTCYFGFRETKVEYEVQAESASPVQRDFRYKYGSLSLFLPHRQPSDQLQLFKPISDEVFAVSIIVGLLYFLFCNSFVF